MSDPDPPPTDADPTGGDPRGQVRDPVGSSPGAGCIIFILALALFGGIITYAIYAGIKQDRDIVKFTSEQRLELPDEPGTPDELAATRAKITAFIDALRDSKPAQLEITTSDLNRLIHNETATMEIRDMIYFDEITADEIRARISLPINRLLPWKPQRYLNGTATLKVEAAPGQLFLRLAEVDSPGKHIEPGFLEIVAQNDLLAPYKNDDNEDVFAAVQSAEMSPGKVTIHAAPATKADAPN